MSHLEITSCLNFTCPYFQKPFSQIEGIEFVYANGQLTICGELDIPINAYQELIRPFVEDALVMAGQLCVLELRLTSKIKAHAPSSELNAIPSVPGIKNILAVASGKGGVGKSTTAVNLAVAMAKMGARVGLLDADIYGPSIPKMLGLTQQAQVKDKKLIPLDAYGISFISIGNLVETSVPAIWRGPMASGALIQLLTDTKWPDLDYLFIDLPPGTGDVQLTLAQKVPVTGAVIVTTPQNIATQDATKGLAMFNKVGIPVLGVIENMSYFLCPSCGHEENIFGCDGAKDLASRFEVPLIAQVPLLSEIQQRSDSGQPVAFEACPREHKLSALYQDAAIKIAVLQSKTKKNLSFGMPKVVLNTTG